jgi:hypothetical protein
MWRVYRLSGTGAPLRTRIVRGHSAARGCSRRTAPAACNDQAVITVTAFVTRYASSASGPPSEP